MKDSFASRDTAEVPTGHRSLQESDQAVPDARWSGNAARWYAGSNTFD